MNTSQTKSKKQTGGQNRLVELAPGCFSFSADGCSNIGVVVGSRGLLVIDAQAAPHQSAAAMEAIRRMSDKPIKVLALTHFHADSTGGAAVFGAGEIIASDLTQRLLSSRGVNDGKVLKRRFPDAFVSADGSRISPSMTIASSMTIDLGGIDVRLMHLGRGHTMGDLVVWVPSRGVLYAGDLVCSGTSPYCGDAHLADWPRALDRILAFRPSALVPGRGQVALGASAVSRAVEMTRSYLTALRAVAASCAEDNLGLKGTYQKVGDVLERDFGSLADFGTHLPFNVARAYEETRGTDQPQAWTLERYADLEDLLGSLAPARGQGDASNDAGESDGPSSEVGAATVEASASAIMELVSDTAFEASLMPLEPGAKNDSGKDQGKWEAAPEDVQGAADPVLEDAKV